MHGLGRKASEKSIIQKSDKALYLSPARLQHGLVYAICRTRASVAQPQLTLCECNLHGCNLCRCDLDGCNLLDRCNLPRSRGQQQILQQAEVVQPFVGIGADQGIGVLQEGVEQGGGSIGADLAQGIGGAAARCLHAPLQHTC